MIRVLVVDDSAVVRNVLTRELSKFHDIDVVGTAIDPYAAREKILQLKPDVLTLDIEMPRLDGLSFLVKLMKHYPMPVVIVSSLTAKNSDMVLQALRLGAVEVINKPGSSYSTPTNTKDLARAIRAASLSKIDSTTLASVQAAEAVNQDSSIKNIEMLELTHKIVAIGASTGGTTAIEKVLQSYPATAPGTVIVQHMPKYFTASFAKRLDSICAVKVKEAKQNEIIRPGLVLVAPGDLHMVIKRVGATLQVVLKDGPRVHFQKPAVDVLFQSVAHVAGKNAVGVILTGMGSDGAKGLLEMRNRGAYTIAQDKKTSIVFGMPKVAIEMGGAELISPLEQISQKIFENFISRN